MEDKWEKLRQIVREEVRAAIREELPTKKVNKISFVDGAFVGLGEREMSALSAAFPAVDLQKEIREMTAWLIMKPDDAPKSNYANFIHQWLKKHQNQASIRSIPPVRSEPLKMECIYCGEPAFGTTGTRRHCRKDECRDKAAMNESPRRAA